MEEKGNDEKTVKERVKNRKEFTVTVLMRVVLAGKRYKIYMGCKGRRDYQMPSKVTISRPS